MASRESSFQGGALGSGRTLIVSIWLLSSRASLVVIEAAMTGRETPHARPSAVLLGTKTYGTFLSSQSSGRWSRISIGSVSGGVRKLRQHQNRIAAARSARERAGGRGAERLTGRHDDELADTAVQGLCDRGVHVSGRLECRLGRNIENTPWSPR